MDKAQNINSNANNNSSSMAVGEFSESQLLTQKVDEITGSEMKKVEVQKMEDCLTIKMLQREYQETKRNLTYSQKKLEEAQKNVSTQSKTIDQLVHANKAIVEKFNELKRFQCEIILININNSGETFIDCRNKNVELSNTLQMILEKENYIKYSNKNILSRREKLNNDVQRQFEQKRGVSNNFNEMLTQTKKRNEIHKTQLNQETLDNNLNDLIDEKTKIIIQLEADEEVFHKTFKQEINDSTQEKNNKLQDLEDKRKNLGEKKDLISKLQSELPIIDKNTTSLKDELEKAKSKKDDIVKEVTKKRQINELSKKALSENINNIKSEQEKIIIELKAAESKFSKYEDDMQAELKNLKNKITEKDKLLTILENYQHDLAKLEETKMAKQKELSSKEQYDKLKRLTDELKRSEPILLKANKQRNESCTKIEELQEERNSIKKKLESSNNNQINVTESNLNAPNKVSKNCPIYKRATQSIADNFEHDLNEVEQSSETLKKAKESISPQKKSINSFDIDKSDDEFKIRNVASETSIEFIPSPQKKKTVYNANWIDENFDKATDNPAESDDLFDKLLSQSPFLSTRVSKDEDVFKVPQMYMTPIRKKASQIKNMK